MFNKFCAIVYYACQEIGTLNSCSAEPLQDQSCSQLACYYADSFVPLIVKPSHCERY
jgi:hypothetical protein